MVRGVQDERDRSIGEWLEEVKMGGIAPMVSGVQNENTVVQTAREALVV